MVNPPSSSADAAGATPDGVRSVLELGLTARGTWGDEELALLLAYHLEAPLDFDLRGLDPAHARGLRHSAAAEGLLVRSLGDLFGHPRPPLELVEMMKDYAKSSMKAGQSALPKPVAAAIYYLSIAVALARLGRRITHLDDAQLRDGFDWAIALPWMDAAGRDMLSRARQCLRQER
jgi:hypothetical protein